MAEIIGGIRLNQGKQALHTYNISPDNANLIADIFTTSPYQYTPPKINGTFSLMEGVAKIVRGTISIPINSTYSIPLLIDIDDTAFIWDGAWTLTFAAVINIGGTFSTAETVTLYGGSSTELATFTSAGSYSFNMAKLFRFSDFNVTRDDFNSFVPRVTIKSNLTSTQVTASADILELVLINSKEAQ